MWLSHNRYECINTWAQGRIQGVCLAVMTSPFVLQVGYSALKPMIKYQTLSLQVSNVGGLKQATAYISLLTLHSTIMKQQRLCLVWMAPVQWHETIPIFEHFKLILHRMFPKHTCFGISSSGSATSNASEAARSSYTGTHTQSCFLIFYFMARGHSVQTQSFCFAVSAQILSAVYTY